MGSSERITPIAKPEPCDVTRWIKAAPRAAKIALRNRSLGNGSSGWSSGGVLDSLNDTWDVDQVVRVVRGIKKDMCPDCPREDCPTEKIMSYLNDAPLKRGADIVIGKFFEEPTLPPQPSAPPALNP